MSFDDELREFLLEAESVSPPEGFKERLREKLWEMLSRDRRPHLRLVKDADDR